MVAFVTVDEAKRGMRIDSYDDDGQIEFLISAASQAILNYLKVSSLDSPSDFTPDDTIKNATIFLVKYWYDNEDAQESQSQLVAGMYQLPPVVLAMLSTYRVPTLA